MESITDKDFSKTSFREHPLARGEYENCTFSDCDFSDCDLMHFRFIDCRFITCNLSLIKTNDTSFQQASFKGCKMLGVRFDLCKTFNLSFTFDNCTLDHSSFYRLNIKKTVFRDCGLKSVDFTACDLSGSSFARCNFADAMIDRANLEKADFRDAINYRIDPEVNKMKKARFSTDGLPGLLAKYDILIE
ncbi:pentapeptide repeat-containing protein [Chryseolinea sp. T2]|uniref:pentapeptide repeat-containing protein n=1 Tax=Chryseolinea sp. T2 TaxID=3129255 RepID=UPI0030769A2E